MGRKLGHKQKTNTQVQVLEIVDGRKNVGKQDENLSITNITEWAIKRIRVWNEHITRMDQNTKERTARQADRKNECWKT